MDYYNLDEILNHAIRNNIDISPSDRLEWAMFCCALKVLGYSEETFANLSSCSPLESLKKWREEKSPGRYFATPDKAKAKLIALAKAAGIDLTPFALSAVSAVKCRKVPLSAVKCRNGVNPDTPSAVKCRKVPLSAVKCRNGVNPDTPTASALCDFAGIEVPEPPIYIDQAEVEEMEGRAKESTLYAFLCGLFPTADVDEVFRRYRVGATSAFGSAPGLASAFPYINAAGACIDVHLQPYDLNGHRKKEGFSQDWQLRRDGHKERRGKWCLFGEHLAGLNPSAPIGIVESEKTALICALYFPGYLWMATGSLSNLNAQRCSAVKERGLYIFPDLDGLAKWREKAKALHAEGFRIFFCGDTIKRHAAGAKDDLGDIVLNALSTSTK